MLNKRYVYMLGALCLSASLLMGGCQKAPGASEPAAAESETAESEEDSQEEACEDAEAPVIEGLSFEGKMELSYAERFKVYKYEGGYGVVEIPGSDTFLVVPEGGEIPEGLDPSYKILQKPLDRQYMTATSIMALYEAMDALPLVKMTGTQSSGWYLEDTVAALESGAMLFAGKYSDPDYELLLKEGCNLSVQSTMILHAPKVKEMLEDLGIPVLVEYSTHEQHPLGKLEWIRLFGFLADKEEEADAFFKEQENALEELAEYENTEKKVAYFYVNTSGQVVVREVTDYIPKMIELGGGRYIFDEQILDGNEKSTATITMEEFYQKAIDADYLVYNASIDEPLESIQDLLAKSDLFADFKAVKEGNVWCTGKAMFQQSDKIADFILDFHKIVTGSDGQDTSTFYKLK